MRPAPLITSSFSNLPRTQPLARELLGLSQPSACRLLTWYAIAKQEGRAQGNLHKVFED